MLQLLTCVFSNTACQAACLCCWCFFFITSDAPRVYCFESMSSCPPCQSAQSSSCTRGSDIRSLSRGIRLHCYSSCLSQQGEAAVEIRLSREDRLSRSESVPRLYFRTCLRMAQMLSQAIRQRGHMHVSLFFRGKLNSTGDEVLTVNISPQAQYNECRSQLCTQPRQSLLQEVKWCLDR